jgi:type I restriction enzyme M protein
MSSRPLDIRRDDLNRFYTRREIGRLLVDILPPIAPQQVLDLGAGEGSLSLAAADRWPDAQYLTVDKDPSSSSELCGKFSRHVGSVHKHLVHDVFDPFMFEAVAEKHGFDLAVCNPPFFRPTWHRDYALILQAGGLADACPSTADVSAEVLFLAQSLRLLREGGVAALIVPDGLATGWPRHAFRRVLLRDFSVECSVQLPAHSFHDTEARCFILVIRKTRPTADLVKLIKYEPLTGISAPILVTADQAERRMDYDYYRSTCGLGNAAFSLRELGADVRRGSISTVFSKTVKYPVFHTTNFRDQDRGLFEFDKVNNLSDRSIVIAEEGDILVARVDRSLHLKVAMVTSGSIALTDCVYRVRVPADAQKKVFNALRSTVGAGRLQAATKGVGARLLGKADFLDLKLEAVEV